ncbi:hypothetical protein JW960_14005 [candidate division KSB1 bacterium]|nr:hypothetical protein [candidate division KSB1 bacterium]
MRKIKILVLMMIVAAAMPAYSQKTNNQLQDDIEIMETILNKLFSTSGTTKIFQTSAANGYYLENYGILFKVPYANEFTHRNHEEQLLILPNGRGVQKQVAIKKDGDNAISDSIEQANLEQVKTTIVRFLGDYASSMNELKSDEWIMVVVDFNNDMKWLGAFPPQNDIRKLIAKVKMKDVTTYRHGKMDRDALAKQITFESRTQQSAGIDEDIEVFADIIKSSIEKSQIDGLHIINHVNGFYLNGYGAIIMMDTQMFPRRMQIITNRTQNGAKHNITIDKFIHDDGSFDSQASIAALQDRMINVLSRFGHTIRNLNGNEWLEIAISIDDHSNANDFSRLMMRINKNDIERSVQKRMNESDVRKMIHVVKY